MFEICLKYNIKYKFNAYFILEVDLFKSISIRKLRYSFKNYLRNLWKILVFMNI